MGYRAGSRVLASDVSVLADSAWTAFTPTWTNLTVGNGVLTCSYYKVSRLIHASYSLLFGSTTAITGSPTVTLPESAAPSQSIVVTAEYKDDTPTVTYPGFVYLSGTVLLPCTTASPRASISSTSPMTWTTSDRIGFQVDYQSAS